MRFRNLLTVVSLMFVALPSHALTYTWGDSGTDWATAGNWRTNAPSAPTKFIYTPPTPPGASDIASFTNDASILNPPEVAGPQSILGLNIDNHYKGWNFTGGTGTLTIGTNGLTISNGDYNSPRATTIGIPIMVTGTQNWTATSANGFSEWAQRASLLITNAIGGTGSIVFSGPSIILTSTNGLTFSDGSRMTSRTRTAMQIADKVITGDLTFGMGGGPITLDGGWFQVGVCVETGSAANLQFFCTNAIVVTPRGGILDAAADPRAFTGASAGATVNPLIRFTGPITLGGPLLISGAMYYYAAPRGNADGSTVLHEFRGDITLDHTDTACLQLYEQGDGRGNYVRVTGTIADGTPHTYRHPLIMTGLQNYLQYTGTGSTYSDGTVIDFTSTWDGQNSAAYYGDGGVRVAGGSLLGTSDVTVLPDGMLSLGSTNCVSIGTGKRVKLEYASNALSTLLVGGDSDVSQILSSDSYGAVGLQSNNSKVNDQSLIGNGKMFLGCGGGRDRTSGASLTVASLAPCSDGIWRLGAGGGWLTRNANNGGGSYGGGRLDFTQNGVISGSGTMQVGDYARYGGGYVAFQQPINGFTGTMDLRNSGVIGYALTTVGGYTLGDPNGDVNLHNGLLRYANVSSTANVKLGYKRNVSFEGGYNLISAHSGAACYSKPGNAVNTLTVLGMESLVRVRRGQLLLDAYSDRWVSSTNNYSGARTVGTERILMTNAPPVCGGIVPPYIVAHNSWVESYTTYYDFATYRNTSDAGGKIGFDRAMCSSASLATSTLTDLVSQASITLTANAHAYAIKMNGNIATNNVGSAPVLTLGTNGYAGLLANTSCTLTPLLDCKTNELVIWTTGGTLLLTSEVYTSGGLTKAGDNHLYLFSAANANSVTGTITVNRGVVFAQFDSAAGSGSLGDASNRIVLNGGYLSHAEGALGGASWPSTGNRLLASRTIELGPLGGAIGSNLNGKNLYIYSPITGTGEFRTADHANSSGAIVWVMNGANDYSGGTRVTTSRDLRAEVTGRLGTGDVIVEGSQSALTDGPNFTGSASVLRLYGSNNLGPTARLWLFRRDLAYAYMYTNTCNVASIGGTGNIVLGRTAGPGNDTTMVIGADDSSCDFYGVIQQAAATSPGKGGVTKVGNGKFTLYNSQPYTLDTTVNGGTLALMGSVASNVVVNANGALGGIGRVKGNLLINTGGKLAIVIRGDTDADSITVDKIADIASGTLDVSFAPGYVPPKGKLWTILTAGTLSGNFAGASSGFSTRRVGNTILVTNPPKGTVLEVQ